MTENLEDMLLEALGDSTKDKVDRHIEDIENEYIALKTKTSLDQDVLQIREKIKELQKELKKCKNIKNTNMREQNKLISKKRELLRTQIKELEMLLQKIDTKAANF